VLTGVLGDQLQCCSRSECSKPCGEGSVRPIPDCLERATESNETTVTGMKRAQRATVCEAIRYRLVSTPALHGGQTCLGARHQVQLVQFCRAIFGAPLLRKPWQKTLFPLCRLGHAMEQIASESQGCTTDARKNASFGTQLLCESGINIGSFSCHRLFHHKVADS
jgi:hypothetical protein